MHNYSILCLSLNKCFVPEVKYTSRAASSINIGNYTRTLQSVSPGEMFNVSLLTIDQYSNSIDGVQVMNDQTNTDDYRINYHHSSVTNSSLILFYDVVIRNGYLVTNGSKLNFFLYVDVEGQCRNYTNFDITLKPCPFGFEFSSDISKCSCAKVLQKFTEDCIIENITISRSSNNRLDKFYYRLHHPT